MQCEGFFYRSSPFIGTVMLSADNKEYPCHLFRAATGFFYHYLMEDISGNHFALHNRSETNFNPAPFEMAGAVFSEKSAETAISILQNKNLFAAEQPIRQYMKKI